MDAPTEQQLARGNWVLGCRRQTALLYPMLDSIKVHRRIRLCVSFAKYYISYAASRRDSLAHARVYEALLWEQLNECCSTTLEAGLRLAIAGPRFLTFVTSP